MTYDSRNGEALLLGVLEETEHVIAGDNTRLAGQLVKDSHCEDA